MLDIKKTSYKKLGKLLSKFEKKVGCSTFRSVVGCNQKACCLPVKHGDLAAQHRLAKLGQCLRGMCTLNAASPVAVSHSMLPARKGLGGAVCASPARWFSDLQGLLGQKLVHKQDHLASVNRQHELFTGFEVAEQASAQVRLPTHHPL